MSNVKYRIALPLLFGVMSAISYGQTPREAMLSQAQCVADCIVGRNFDCIVDNYDPIVVTALGGRIATKTHVLLNYTNFLKMGMSIDSVSIEPPTSSYKSMKHQFYVVPVALHFNLTKGGKMSIIHHMVAASKNAPNQPWYFTEPMMHADTNALYIIYPDCQGRIVIPPTQYKDPAIEKALAESRAMTADADSLLHHARLMFSYFQNNQTEKYIKYFNPKIIEQLGGKVAATSHFREENNGLINDQITIDTTIIYPPSDTIVSRYRTYYLIPVKMKMTQGKIHETTNTFLVGYKSKTAPYGYIFVELSMVDKLELLLAYYPDLKGLFDMPQTTTKTTYSQ